MARRAILPRQWRKLSRSERVEMMAYEWKVDERLDKVLTHIRETVPGEFGMLAQVLTILKFEG